MPLDAPYRGLLGAPGRPAGVPLPPGPLPLVLGGRVRKRWRYVGAFGPELSLCVGLVRIGPLTQSFWAVWDRGAGTLHERTRPRAAGVRVEPGRVVVEDGRVRIDLRIDEDAGDAVETVTPYGPAHAWTLKRAAVPVRGTVELDGRRLVLAPDLTGVRSAGRAEVDLAFVPEATRRRRQNLVLVRSSYEQPFGTFTGTLPGGARLVEGFGVMERHVAVW